MERLLQKQAAGDGARSDRRKSGRVDHRKFGVVLSASFGDLPAVNLSGQPDVCDENVGGPSSTPGQRLLAVGSVNDVKALFAQGLDDELADERVILHHKNAH